MAKRTIQRDPELLAHQQWLGYLQPVGLVVAPAAMQEAGWVVTRSGSELIERQERYREALEDLGANEDGDADDRVLGFSSIETLLVDHLGWSGDQIQSAPNLIEAYTRELSELGETLQPTALVPAASGEGVQLLVQELPLLAPLDQKFSGGDQHWRASSQERFERLLRETGIEAGLLFNGSQLRLVVAPKGESSGHLTFTLKDLADVSGRLMFSGLDLLLGQSHVFLDPDGYRLVDVLNKSRSYQTVVSNALADQVLAALWDLLRGFERADQLSQQQGTALLGDIPDTAPEQLYGGLITVLMRLVFLLYAEDEALMPTDAVYEQNYKVSSIFEQLQQDAAEFPDTMEQRFGAWAGLMSLCRLVFDGGGATADYLPARHGQLFDPEPYPWLETPLISDGVVHSVLSNLLVVSGERISYRALDVEQIGSVYEGIMGYEVQRVEGASIGLRSSGQGSKKQFTTTIDLTKLLLAPPKDRKKLVESLAQTGINSKSGNEISKAETIDELLACLESRIDNDLFAGPLLPGSLVFQPTEERRRSGSHYTPRSLTRPIAEKAIEPWLKTLGRKPSAEEVLRLRICDPAMGSGAFLVEMCRLLAELLTVAWNEDGLPSDFPAGEDPEVYARRIVAQRCLYGVDKNIFAVNLARLSLWLVSLSKDAPFTFVDHALKHGDSLVGLSTSEINAFIRKSEIIQGSLFASSREISPSVRAAARRDFLNDTRSDADDDRKRQLFNIQEKESSPLRFAGDLAICAYFDGKDAQARKTKEQTYSQLLFDSRESDDALLDAQSHVTRLQKKHGIAPFHWDLEFPEIFDRSSPGFDIFIGNPPFLGALRISETTGGPLYLSRLKQKVCEAKGHVDLCAFFFARAFSLLSQRGTLNMIATSAISTGDNKTALTSSVQSSGGKIYSATTEFTWPGSADVVVSIVHIAKNIAGIEERCSLILNGNKVSDISFALKEEVERAKPKKLYTNIGLCFQGTNIGGMGFVLSAEEANGMLKTGEYNGVIKPLVSGDSVNGFELDNDKRYVISFGSMSLLEAEKFPAALEIVKERVKPKRDQAKDHGPGLHGKKYWWQHTLRADPLYEAISQMDRCLVRSYVSTSHCLKFMPTRSLFNNSVAVFAFEDFASFAVLQSSFHGEWTSRYCSNLGKTIRYSVTEAFETFPFPEHYRESEVLLESGEAYYSLRASICNARSVGLTALYGLVNNPSIDDFDIVEMRSAIRYLDESVMLAYGFRDLSLKYGWAIPDSGEGENDKRLQYRLDESSRDSLIDLLWSLNKSLPGIDPESAVSSRSLKGKSKKKNS